MRPSPLQVEIMLAWVIAVYARDERQVSSEKIIPVFLQYKLHESILQDIILYTIKLELLIQCAGYLWHPTPS